MQEEEKRENVSSHTSADGPETPVLDHQNSFGAPSEQPQPPQDIHKVEENISEQNISVDMPFGVHTTLKKMDTFGNFEDGCFREKEESEQVKTTENSSLVTSLVYKVQPIEVPSFIEKELPPLDVPSFNQNRSEADVEILKILAEAEESGDRNDFN